MFGFKVMLWLSDEELGDTLRNITDIVHSVCDDDWLIFSSSVHDTSAYYKVDEIVQITMLPEVEVVEEM